jgi:uncharacterized transporter YbjL
MRYLLSILQPIAKIDGFVLSVLVVMYAVHIRYNPLSLNMLEFMFSISLFIVWIGLVIGLKHQRIGGWLNLFGIVFCYLIKFSVVGFLPDSWICAFLALPGLLHIICYNLEKRLLRTP